MNPEQVCATLLQALDPNINVRRQAEGQVAQWQATPGFPNFLLTILKTPTGNPHADVAVAICFKNFIQKNWDSTAAEANLPPEVRAQIKEHLVTLCLRHSTLVQAQLKRAIDLIAQSDFPKQWEDLLPGIVREHLQSSDMGVVAGALEVVDTVLMKYRSLMKSDAVCSELKYKILPHIQQPLLQVFLSCCQKIRSPETLQNAQMTSLFGRMILSCCSIMHSLNVVDIPEFFQESINVWFEQFVSLLQWSAPPLESDLDDQPGQIEQIRTAVLNIWTLYADKYQEDFEPLVATCIEKAWTFLVNTPADQEKYDRAVAAGVSFLSSAAQTAWSKGNPFSQDNVIEAICEKIVLPNILLRESDLELFQDNPADFIRRDLEAVDADTRRRSAMDLVRALQKFHSEKVTSVLGGHVSTLLQRAADGGVGEAERERSKEAAVYLVAAVAVKAATRREGVSDMNQQVDVVSIFKNSLFEEISQPLGAGGATSRSIVRAAVLKFVTLFRQQLGAEALVGLIPFVIAHLDSSVAVVHTYAAHCLERLLAMRGPSALPIASVREALFKALESLLTIVIQQRGIRENPEVMKAFWRILHFLKGSLDGGVCVPAIEKLCVVIRAVTEATVNPRFNHFLFEALAVLVKIGTPHNPQAVEAAIVPTLSPVVAYPGGEHDFLPYTLQILALLLDSMQSPSNLFMELFPKVVDETLWKASRANVPGIVRLLESYLAKAEFFGAGLTSPEQLQILFDRSFLCLQHKRTEEAGFELLATIFRRVPADKYRQLTPNMLNVMLNRMRQPDGQSGPVLKRFSLSISFFTAMNGAPTFCQLLENVPNSPNLLDQVLLYLWLPGMTRSLNAEERKVAAVALCRLLEYPPITSNAALLAPVIETLCIVVTGLMAEGPTAGTLAAVAEEEEEEAGAFLDEGLGTDFEVQYSKLASTRNATVTDNFSVVPGGDDLLKYLKTAVGPYKTSIGELAQKEGFQGRSAAGFMFAA